MCKPAHKLYHHQGLDGGNPLIGGIWDYVIPINVTLYTAQIFVCAFEWMCNNLNERI